MDFRYISRRHWLRKSSFSLGSVAFPWLLGQDGLLAKNKKTVPLKPELNPTSHDLSPKAPPENPRARAMISMYMLGGPSQIDLFDPKPELVRLNGKQFEGHLKFDNAAQASREIMGPGWKFSQHGQCGMEISELLPHLGTIADEITLIRSMRTSSNNHVPSNFALTTGKPVHGRPVLGSWLLKALGSETQDLPAYVALTDPRGLPQEGSENWSQGKLPAIYQGTVVRPTDPRIFNLNAAPHLKGIPQKAQLDFLENFNRIHLQKHPHETELEARLASYGLAARMQEAAKEAFDISGEPAAVKTMYGIDNKRTSDYGTRCLIARRLVERGVRFVQIFCAGQNWDHHGSIKTSLPDRCGEIDQPATALIKDLKQRGLLDSTIVHWGGEMGRLPVIQFRNGLSDRNAVGRDHNTYGFSQWVAGGGFRKGYTHGLTDEFSHHAIDGVVNHYDWLATILHLFGLNHKELKFRSGPRDIRLVEESHARVVHELIS
ncbi:MAG: DUF1501 domain-containing protein [Verrucomicrobiales bacterium]|nr:DUF1501 domain-containing protein [Verrucomicrobiales bacterium]